MRGRRGALLLPLLLALQAVGPGPALAHGLNSAVSTGPAVTVTFSFEEGSPVAGCEYEVFGPREGDPAVTGLTDRLGRAVFRPDRPGLWQVRVWTRDGHGATAQVEVGADLLAEDQAGGGSANRDLLAGVAVLFGVFGILTIILKRR